MAHVIENGFHIHGALRSLLALVIYLCSRSPTVKASSSCPSCACNCFPENSILSALESLNNTFADCGKNDPEAHAELKKNVTELLNEELELLEMVTNDTLEHSAAVLWETRRYALDYRKEAEKCNAGVESCELARERAEAELREEKKLTSLWKQRAHKLQRQKKRVCIDI